jgi:hypothetical protein
VHPEGLSRLSARRRHAIAEQGRNLYILLAPSAAGAAGMAAGMWTWRKKKKGRGLSASP